MCESGLVLVPLSILSVLRIASSADLPSPCREPLTHRYCQLPAQSQSHALDSLRWGASRSRPEECISIELASWWRLLTLLAHATVLRPAHAAAALRCDALLCALTAQHTKPLAQGHAHE